uniref:Endonuclease/exonuclease/phosphatase domain-containing protein n=1 Tax=Salarias fasciatus TaxID=181472 RepID=A0A672H4Y0_SALFA
CWDLVDAVKFLGKDNEGRLIIIEVVQDHETYRIINLYCPNGEGERIKFLKQLWKWCSGVKNCFLVGDFNICLTKMDRAQQERHKKDASRTELINLMEQNSLVDIWRILHPNKCQFSRRQVVLGELKQVFLALLHPRVWAGTVEAKRPLETSN